MILITGASGFVGSALCNALADRGCPVRRAVRNCGMTLAKNSDIAVVGEIDGRTQWDKTLIGVDCVIHLAARTHMVEAADEMTLALYRRINVDGTQHLAESASRCGVRRIVFLSSIKVNGEFTDGGAPFTEHDLPRPQDAYGITKWEAEQALRRVAADHGLEVIILRPPLVYGPGVKGNMLRLMRLIKHGAPLPFASIRNQRSLIYVGNLVQAILLCTCVPVVGAHTYLVSDGEDVSTPELAERLGNALGIAARLFPVPKSVLALVGKLVRREHEIARLTNSLQINSMKIRTELGWIPRCSLAEGLADMAHWYRQT